MEGYGGFQKTRCAKHPSGFACHPLSQRGLLALPMGEVAAIADGEGFRRCAMHVLRHFFTITYYLLPQKIHPEGWIFKCLDAIRLLA